MLTSNKQSKVSNNTEDSANNEEDDDGGHDTITSLAGLKMLQKYRKYSGPGSFMRHSGSGSSIDKAANGGNNLEQLFQVMAF